MNATLKGLIMTVVTFFATVISTNGLPSSGTAWIVFAVTVAGTALIYLAKNLVFPSVSVWGTINLADLLSGLILALGTAVSNWAGSWITGTPIIWDSLWKLVLSVVIGYFAKTFVQNPEKETN